MMKKIVLFFAGCVLLSGCGQKAEAPAVQLSEPATTVEKKTLDLSQTGTLSGHIRFEGTPPETRDLSVRGNPECSVLHPGGMIPQEEFLLKDGALQNVFVYVKSGLEGYTFAPPADAVTVDNHACRYAPHVLGAQVGQTVNILNSDATLHNVHAFAKTNKSWNIGLPLQGLKQTKTFSQPEVMVKLKCDVHPWMTGYIGVLPHPYFQVTGEDGAFELKNLPAGTYEIEAWHEKLGTKTQAVTLTANETKSVDFTFSGTA